MLSFLKFVTTETAKKRVKLSKTPAVAVRTPRSMKNASGDLLSSLRHRW